MTRNSRTQRASAKVITFGAALLMATLGTAALATPATAGTADCPSGYACLWGDTQYRTAGIENNLVGFFQCYHDLRLGIYNNGYGGTMTANDAATSVSNKGVAESARFYYDLQYTGASFLLAKGTGDGYLNDSSGNAPGGFNDKITSAKFTSALTTCL